MYHSFTDVFNHMIHKKMIIVVMRGAGETGEKEDEENEGDEIQRSR